MNNHQVSPEAINKLRTRLVFENYNFSSTTKRIQQMSDYELVDFAADEIQRLSEEVSLLQHQDCP